MTVVSLQPELLLPLSQARSTVLKSGFILSTGPAKLTDRDLASGPRAPLAALLAPFRTAALQPSALRVSLSPALCRHRRQ